MYEYEIVEDYKYQQLNEARIITELVLFVIY